MASNASMIALDSVYKTYSEGNTALNGISLNIEKGEFVFIVGPSGSGKTTLFKLLLKELEATSGTILMNGENIRRLKRRNIAKMRRGIGVVFQDFRLLKDRSVYENVAFAQRVVGKSTKFIKESVPKLLETVGLQDKGNSNPYQLSGGEQQRVALARALANHPPLILADEPTGNLDPENSWHIMNLLEAINKTGTTVIVVTHNTSIVSKMNKRVITMNDGVIIDDSQGGPVDIKVEDTGTYEGTEIAFEKFKESADSEKEPGASKKENNVKYSDKTAKEEEREDIYDALAGIKDEEPVSEEEFEMTEEELEAIFKKEPEVTPDDLKDKETFSVYEEFLDDESTSDISEVVEQVKEIEDEKGGETF